MCVCVCVERERERERERESGSVREGLLKMIVMTGYRPTLIFNLSAALKDNLGRKI